MKVEEIRIGETIGTSKDGHNSIESHDDSFNDHRRKRRCLRMDCYQWTVFAAAWAGRWSDSFDVTLFGLILPNAFPALLDLPIGSEEAKSATLYWTGLLTSCALIAWATGGVVFGLLADWLGRSRSLMLTILVFSAGTAISAASRALWFFFVFRLLAATGTGGEFAAGASWVAETLPENARVMAGAILNTAAPVGVFAAALTNQQVAGEIFKDNPGFSWRYVLLFGLIPAGLVLIARLFIKEPELVETESSSSSSPSPSPSPALPNNSDEHTPLSPNSKGVSSDGLAGGAASHGPTSSNRLRQLWEPQNRPYAISGLVMSCLCLLTVWPLQAMLPIIASEMAQSSALSDHLSPSEATSLREAWKSLSLTTYNVGGLAGSLVNPILGQRMGRRGMFAVYFVLTIAGLIVVYGISSMPPMVFLWCQSWLGFATFGVVASFGYYLPELFPPKLRATGTGFCFNAGRVLAAGGPFLVGTVSSQGGSEALNTARWCVVGSAVFPLIGLILIPFLVIETRRTGLRQQ